MAMIKAPNPINGIHVSLEFKDGMAQTNDEWLIQWFRSHGYTVTDSDEPPEDPISFNEMEPPEMPPEKPKSHRNKE